MAPINRRASSTRRNRDEDDNMNVPEVIQEQDIFTVYEDNLIALRASMAKLGRTLKVLDPEDGPFAHELDEDGYFRDLMINAREDFKVVAENVSRLTEAG